MSEYRQTYDRVFKGANENFKGRTLNKQKREMYEALLHTAKELSKATEGIDNINYGFTEVTNERRNALVYLEAETPIFLTGNEEKAIAVMAQDADDTVITVLPNGKVRISFGVRDIWSE